MLSKAASSENNFRGQFFFTAFFPFVNSQLHVLNSYIAKGGLRFFHSLIFISKLFGQFSSIRNITKYFLCMETIIVFFGEWACPLSVSWTFTWRSQKSSIDLFVIYLNCWDIVSCRAIIYDHHNFSVHYLKQAFIYSYTPFYILLIHIIVCTFFIC